MVFPEWVIFPEGVFPDRFYCICPKMYSPADQHYQQSKPAEEYLILVRIRAECFQPDEDERGGCALLRSMFYIE